MTLDVHHPSSADLAISKITPSHFLLGEAQKVLMQINCEAADPDGSVAVPLSANGMVRPCSRPASNQSWEGASRQGARHVPDTERYNCRGWYRYRQELFPHRGPRRAWCHWQKWSRSHVEA